MQDETPPRQKRSHHSHRLSGLIRDDIVRGLFPPGARLKAEDLAARYDVSANPVREALWRLHGEGFVETIPNQGARVRVVDDDFVRNIYELRRLIEPHLVRRFCARASAADIARLRAASADFAAEANGPDAEFFRMDDLNRAFHAVILEGEPNVEAIRALDRYAVLLSLARSKLAVTRGRLLTRVREHELIVAAIAAGDADRAAAAADQHIRSAEDDFVDQMRRARADGGADDARIRALG
jgi:DNA-binding GntR family transcriptional regulator